VAKVSPNSAVWGPISLVMSGDITMIDVDQRILDIQVSGADLAARRARLGEPVLPKATGYLSIYLRTMQPLLKGAVLVRETPKDKS
jgi:dihydroxy-acid dehydratase